MAVADCYLGEIRTFAGNSPPKGWLPCDGRLLKITENQALHALLGTNYGGDGTNTFALPDLRGRTPMGLDFATHQNAIGERGGVEQVQLTEAQMAPHFHNLTASDQPGMTGGVANAIFSAVAPAGSIPAPAVYVADNTMTARVSMDPDSVKPNGGSQAHNNMQPYLVVNFMIATQGNFPSRN